MDPRDLRQAFAANLRRLRHARGISQEDLAYEANINRTYLSKLEKGASYPGLEIIAKLATVLEVEPAALLRVPPECPKVCAAADDRVSHTFRTGSGARTASFSVGGARRVMLSNLRVGSEHLCSLTSERCRGMSLIEIRLRLATTPLYFFN